MRQPNDKANSNSSARYFKGHADQDLTTPGDPPCLLGQPFDGPTGHTATIVVHYNLHI